MLALELHEDADLDVIPRFSDINFIRRILQEARARGIHSDKEIIPAHSLKNAPLVVPVDSSDSDDDSDSHRPKHHVSWSAFEMSKFRYALQEYAGKRPDWRALARRFPGKSQEECRRLYSKMKESKQIDIDLVDAEEEPGNGLDRFKYVTVVQFCYKRSHAWVGPLGRQLKDRAMRNPLLNYVDTVTHKKIIYPAVSPSMHLLDYTTWLRIIQRKGPNPYTGEKVAKRWLELVTMENIRELANKIRNLEESRPPDPADDHLAEVLAELSHSSNCDNSDD
jgi:hypothetical protein